MSATAPVNRIIPFSAVDGPGNRTAIFLQGCPFDCKYCHNPETIHFCTGCGVCLGVCPTGALSHRDGEILYDRSKCVMCDACIKACPHGSCPRIRNLSAGEAMEEVRKNLPFIRGVTVSGGECTLHRAFLMELAPFVHQAGLTLLLDSNGSYDFSADAAFLDAIDGVMLDVKAWDPAEHQALIRHTNDTVLKNLRFLAEAGKLAEVRTVVVPDQMNAAHTVENVSRVLVSLGAGNVPYKLIRFRPIGVREAYKHFRSPGSAELDALERIARAQGMQTIIQI